MMVKKYEIIYTVFLFLAAIFVFCLMYIIADATINGIKAVTRVKDFISQESIDTEYENYGYKVVFHKIQTDRDLGGDTIADPNMFMDDPYDMYLGEVGDYFVMPISTISKLGILKSAMCYMFGGHAGIIGKDELDNPILIEAMGGTEEEMYVYYHDSSFDVDLFLPEQRSVIGFRVNNISMEEREKAYQYSLEQVGKKYNYLFVINELNKIFKSNCYYCSDLVSRSFSYENGLNYHIDSYNPIYVSTFDLAASSDSYITFFKYIDQDDVIHVYYLAN